MARRLARIEVWTDLQAAGGSASAVINDWISATETRELVGKEVLRVELRRESNAWSSLQERRVLRAVLSDGTWSEWRITKIRQLRDNRNQLIGAVDCDSPKYDLGTTLVQRTEADGTVNPYFELYRLSPADHLGVILGNASTHFAAGSVGSTVGVDLVYNWDNALSAVDNLAREAGLEFVITGTSASYTVAMPSSVGSTAGTVYFRYARNLGSVQRDAETQTEFATRVFPRGGGAQGERPTIAGAAWLVSAASSVTITLSTAEGVPVAIADQLNGLWAESSTGKLSAISDGTSGGVLTLAAGHSIGTNERVRFRGSSTGADLIYLDDPANAATYGTVQRVVDRPDIPSVDNLISNGFLDNWAIATVPDDWAKVGVPTVSESTVSINHRYGISAARVQCTSSGQGLQTDVVVVEPSTVRPFFTGQISLRVVSGTVKLELVDTSSTQGGLYPPEGSEPAITSEVGVWIESLGIGGIDFNEVSSTGIRLRVTSYSTGTSEFYLDAAMLTQTAGGADTFYRGRASNDLWLAGVEWLLANATPRVAFDIDMVDLERLHPEVFSAEPLVLGGTVQVTDTDLGLDFQTRAIEIIKDLDRPGVSRVKLSNRPEDLSGLGVPMRRTRSIRPQQHPEFRRPTVEITSSTAGSTSTTFQIRSRSDGQLVALYHQAHASTAPAASTGWTRAPSTGWKESGWAVPVTVARPGLDDPAQVLEAYALDRRGARSVALLTMLDAQPLIVPEVEAILSQLPSGPGQVELQIYDPGTYVDRIAYEVRSGSAGTAVFTPSTDPINWAVQSTDASKLTQTVALGEKHDSYIAWAVRWDYGSTSGARWIKRVETLDVDDVPEVQGSAVFNAAGTVLFDYNGDDDVKSIDYRVSTTGYYATVPSSLAQTVDGRTGSVSSTLTLAVEEIGYVTIRPYGTAGGAGSTGPLLQIKTPAFSVGEDGGNWVKIINPRFTRLSAATWGIDIDIEVGSLTEKVGILYTDPVTGALTPVVPAHGVETAIVQAVGTVRSTSVSVKSTAGGTVTWDITSTAPSVLITPISTVPADGNTKPFHFDVIGVEPTAFSRAVNQAGGGAALRESQQPSTGMGIELSTAGTWETKMADVSVISDSDPTGAWGSKQAGWIWWRPV